MTPSHDRCTEADAADIRFLAERVGLRGSARNVFVPEGYLDRA